jgi:hypothetical protein
VLFVAVLFFPRHYIRFAIAIANQHSLLNLPSDISQHRSRSDNQASLSHASLNGALSAFSPRVSYPLSTISRLHLYNQASSHFAPRTRCVSTCCCCPATFHSNPVDTSYPFACIESTTFAPPPVPTPVQSPPSICVCCKANPTAGPATLLMPAQ